MKCCFSGRETPTDKRFVLYYPPAMVHQKWEKSVYACGRAGETIKETVERLQSFFKLYVLSSKVISRLAIGVVGVVLFLLWLEAAYVSRVESGLLARWGQLLAAIILMSIGFNLFPSSTASVGEQEKLNLVQRAYARLFPGEHW